MICLKQDEKQTSPPRTAGQIDVFTKAAKDDTPASKCSVSGNNKKIKALLINHYPIDHDIERLKYATLLLSIETFPLLKCFGLYD